MSISLSVDVSWFKETRAFTLREKYFYSYPAKLEWDSIEIERGGERRGVGEERVIRNKGIYSYWKMVILVRYRKAGITRAFTSTGNW